MLPVSALFEKGVKFFKTDCFVSATRIAWQKSPRVSGFLKVQILRVAMVYRQFWYVAVTIYVFFLNFLLVDLAVQKAVGVHR